MRCVAPVEQDIGGFKDRWSQSLRRIIEGGCFDINIGLGAEA
jgi:hypothetical protein